MRNYKLLRFISGAAIASALFALPVSAGATTAPSLPAGEQLFAAPCGTVLDSLYSIDTTTAAGTPIGAPQGSPSCFGPGAWDEATNSAMLTDWNGSPYGFSTINPTTGAWSRTATVTWQGTDENMQAVAFGLDGTAYGSDYAGNFYTFNAATGVASSSVPFTDGQNPDYLVALAVDPVNGKLYGVIHQDQTSGDYSVFEEIDPSTGIGTILFNPPVTSPITDGIWALAFDTNGTAWIEQNNDPGWNGSNIMWSTFATNGNTTLNLVGTTADGSNTPNDSYAESLFVNWVPPVAPSGITGTVANGTLTASWNAVPNALTYTVSIPGGQSCTATAPATSCTISGVVGTSATFTVTTHANWASSSASSPYTTPSPTPLTPASLASTGVNLSMLIFVTMALFFAGLLLRRRNIAKS